MLFMAQTSYNRDIIYANDQAETISLNGEWTLELAGHLATNITVPSAWETPINDRVTEGPAIYHRSFWLPSNWVGNPVVLQAHAISFASTIRVNGQSVGTHTGMWAPSQFDVTPYIRLGHNELEIEVWKPGRRYPMRQCLAGFLPDVASTFGGIWQGILLRKVSSLCAYDIHYHCDINGTLHVDGKLATHADVSQLKGTVSADTHDKPVITELTFDQKQDAIGFYGECHISQPSLWKIGQPNSLLNLTIKISASDPEMNLSVTRRVSFRHITADGAMLRFNGAPAHLRGVLDWGWDAQLVCPTPSREQVIAQIEKARSLGFNMLKLCLFVPDEIAFDVADEMGMPIWLEMPMWLPDVTPDMRQLALREYDAILSRVHHHPSIVIVSLGCELQNNVNADFLTELGAIVSHWMPNVLRCDNSGSAEAYGGARTTLSDFYDYHFYTDPHHFQSMVDHFHRPYQKTKPWIYGEFCDADTARDYGKLAPAPWWLTEPLPLDREDLTWTRDHLSRFVKAGITDQGASISTIGRRQATAVRKHIFEQVRREHATGGYVITGWADTPISSSGVVDDNGRLKFDPRQWRQFNNDTVLLFDRERRRYWEGGDRPIHTDPCCFWQTDAPEFHLIVSSGNAAIQSACIECEFTSDTQRWALPTVQTSVEGGTVSEVAVFAFPERLDRPTPVELTLHAAAELTRPGQATERIENVWPLIAVPQKDDCLRQIDKAVIYHRLTPDLITAVQNGENACLWLDASDSPLVSAMPFWREAIHVFPPHPFWDATPQPGYADMRFFSVATDIAIDLDALRVALGETPKSRVEPIWRRFDARRYTYNDYVVEARIGSGRLYISTLRFAGGSGRQPDRLRDNPMGAWLLKRLLDLCAIRPH